MFYNVIIVYLWRPYKHLQVFFRYRLYRLCCLPARLPRNRRTDGPGWIHTSDRRHTHFSRSAALVVVSSNWGIFPLHVNNYDGKFQPVRKHTNLRTSEVSATIFFNKGKSRNRSKKSWPYGLDEVALKNTTLNIGEQSWVFFSFRLFVLWFSIELPD